MCWRGHRAYTVNVGLALPESVVRSRSLLILNAAAASFQDPDRVRGLSLINDLSAVITASDPSERRAKLFGIDRGRKRCEVVGFRNSAGASQKRRDEACIEIRQARPKSAREIANAWSGCCLFSGARPISYM
jgi:hypothetical protein